MDDAVETSILLPAAPARVWRALTDHREFGQWFRVRLEAPFVAGQRVRGPVTYPGHEHLIFEAWVVAMDEPHRLAWRWHPAASEPGRDYSLEPTTLVELLLADVDRGTRLTVRESGFASLPGPRHAQALRMNGEGWRIQMRNLTDHLSEIP